MRTAAFCLAVCLGLASATWKRQDDSSMAPGAGMSDPMTNPPDPVTTMMVTDPPSSAPPTQPPKPTKLTEIDEILTDFDTLSGSDFYKKLDYEDQLLILEVLTGSEVGKMTAILNEIGYKHFITFLYVNFEVKSETALGTIESVLPHCDVRSSCTYHTQSHYPDTGPTRLTTKSIMPDTRRISC
ncbi:hypothetical protein ElyMa_003501800 [Elysia marginata]|uniref:Uncharacterized protein n=1 Tax=Elysia marginata TaxID=1093978 RepID=A0AAV4EDZ9_9GAST|nr:hypothetical protein ElyMa_003501800 [Elysia marginata]